MIEEDKLKENKNKDVTIIEFENKKITKYKISDNKLKDAAGFAIIEAQKWDRSSEILNEYKSLNSQACVNALFSIELYLKSILLNSGVNVTEERFGHKIYDMYCKLNESLKNKIKKDIKVDEIIYKTMFNEIIKFKSFEEELEYISDDFMYLRYEYEKFINGKQIITLTGFIMSLKSNCRKISLEINSRITTKK